LFPAGERQVNVNSQVVRAAGKIAPQKHNGGFSFGGNQSCFYVNGAAGIRPRFYK
jgi:hypothetical protein